MTRVTDMQSKDILIIGRDFHPDGKETAALIADALAPYMEKQDVTVYCVLLKDILFDIGNDEIHVIDGKSGRELRSFQAVLMTNWFSHTSVRKDIAYALALYFDRHQVPCFNTESLHNRSTSKLSQMMMAAIHGVPIARTVFSLKLKHTKAYLKQAGLDMPFVFKDAAASRGRGNYLLQAIDDIDGRAGEHSEQHPFMAQSMIKSDGSDYRFFVAGGKPRVIIRRMGSGESHLNNTSAGATTEIIPAESFARDVLDDVVRMSQLLHREMTGIDIMIDTADGRGYFLEANPIPQIATGSNVPLKLQALADALAEAASQPRQGDNS